MRTAISARAGLVSAALSAALWCRAGSALASDEQDLAGLLDETIVSGPSKTSEIASDAPATTSTLTAADIRRYGIRSLDEAINFLGMGLITQNPLHSVDIGGRGVLLTADFGNHVLLVLDGHVMNEPWDGTAYFEQGAAIPMELIDHVELVLGPGSVLYGGNAMIGVVNVVTKRATSYGGLHVVAEGALSPAQGRGGAFTSFAPADLGQSGRVGLGLGHTFQIFGRPAEFTGQVELYAQNGPSFEWGPQVVTNPDGSPTDFGPRTPPGIWGGRTTRQYTTSVPTLFARVAVEDVTILARAAEYRRTTPYVNGFNQAISDFDDPRSDERDRWLALDVRHTAHLARRLTLVSHLYGDAYEYEQPLYVSQGSECVTPVPGACVQTALGRSQWAGGEFQLQRDWLGDDRLTTMVGVDGRVRNVGGETDGRPAAGGPVTVVGRRDLVEPVGAVYVQQRYSPASAVHVNGGVRYDSDPRGGQRVSPRLAAAVDVWSGGVAKVIYSEAFRAPAFYEMYYQSLQQDASPDIRPEVVRGLEASFEQRLGTHRLLVGVFRSWWSDMISLAANADGIYQYRNVSSIDNYGYNARAEGSFGELRYGLSLTGAHTRRNTLAGGEPLTVAPQVFGNARLSYDLPGDLPVVAVAASFVGARPADRALDGNFPITPYAPADLELRATLSERVPGLSTLSYRLGGAYATASRSPYVAGPTQTVDPAAAAPPQAELAPINRLTLFLSLQCDLPL